MKVVHTNWNEDFVFCTPKNGNPCVIFVRNVSLRSLKSLFDWGHLLFIHVARGKFCKSRKFRFWSFPEVIMMWRIQWCCSFVPKPFIYEEIEPQKIAKFWNLQYRKIFWPSLRLLNQVDRSCITKIFSQVFLHLEMFYNTLFNFLSIVAFEQCKEVRA